MNADHAMRLARGAEALGSALPPLLVAANHLAASVALGQHGRRRAGSGGEFWQFRPYMPGDPPARIDWRQTAKSDRVFVRDAEHEAAQTVLLWRDAAPGMAWQSRGATTSKRQRAELLLLALAGLLGRGGERVRLLASAGAALPTTQTLANMAQLLLAQAASQAGPALDRVPAQARLVLFGDFLADLADLQVALSGLAARRIQAQLVQVLDPAEYTLPYEGRVRFEPVAGGASLLVPRVGAIRGAYADALAAHQAGLRSLCAAAGFGCLLHRTDHSPAPILLALHESLARA